MPSPWVTQTEGAKFWLQVVTELKNRGVQDIFIACVDGLKDFPEAIETVTTTNPIESINISLRKVTKTRSSFPTDEAVMKLFYLALRNISKKWTMPPRDWKAALTRFTIQYGDRMPAI